MRGFEAKHFFFFLTPLSTAPYVTRKMKNSGTGYRTFPRSRSFLRATKKKKEKKERKGRFDFYHLRTILAISL